MKWHGKIVRQNQSSHLPSTVTSHLRFLSMISPSTWWNSHRCVTSIVSFLFFEWEDEMVSCETKIIRREKEENKRSTIYHLPSHTTWRLDQLKIIFLERIVLHPIYKMKNGRWHGKLKKWDEIISHFIFLSQSI